MNGKDTASHNPGAQLRVAILTSGALPVPNSLGGAVETLDTQLIVENERAKNILLTIISSWDPVAVETARQFSRSQFAFVRTPLALQYIDRVIFFIARHLIHVQKPMSFRYIVQRLWFINSSSRVLAGGNFDRVVIENSATLFAALRGRGNSARYAGRVYFHLHNQVTHTFGARRQIREVRRVLGVSRFINTTLQRDVGELNPDQLSVLKNGVDRTAFASPAITDARAELRDKWGVDNSEVLFLFSGRLTEEKGAEQLLRAFLQASPPASRLVIAGGYFFDTDVTSDFDRRLRDLALGAGDRIIFTGYVPYDDMPVVYAAADVCCLPSIWEDPAPLAVIECLVAGRPLVTTNSGGIPEYVDDECAIVLNRGLDLTDRLADAILLLANDAELRARMSASALSRGANLGTDRYYADFIRLIDVGDMKE